MAQKGAVGIYRTPLTSRELHTNRALKARLVELKDSFAYCITEEVPRQMDWTDERSNWTDRPDGS
eukprot:1783078-Amphidinium_carterae.1